MNKMESMVYIHLFISSTHANISYHRIGAMLEPKLVVFEQKLGAQLDFIFMVALINNTECTLVSLCLCGI